MKRPNPIRSLFAAPLAFAAALSVAPPPARAVIAIPYTVGKLYDDSPTVVVGTVAAVDAEHKAASVKTAGVPKGTWPAERFLVLFKQPADVFDRVAVDQPVVVLIGKVAGGSRATVHIADTWLSASAEPGGTVPRWVVSGPKADYNRTFPGRTSALVRLMDEAKAGKVTLLNAAENKVFRGGVKPAGTLAANAAALAAGDVNGDKKPDLVVTTAAGPAKLFLATAAGGYEDATAAWGLAAAAGARAAVGDANADGKPDLLVGNTVWLNDGQKFTAAQPPLDLPAGAKVLAAALADVTGDGKPDALFVLADGQLLAFANPGAAGQPWAKHDKASRKLTGDGPAPLAAVVGDFGDDGKPHALVATESGVTRYPLDPAATAPAADFERLTGEKLTNVYKPFAGGLKNPSLTVLDVNGDGRVDVLAAADGGAVLLVNRGFGAFLVNADASAAPPVGGANLPAAVTAATPSAAADVQGDKFDDLFVLAPDGKLFVVDNPPHEAPKEGTGH